jgi:hypothetical protein
MDLIACCNPASIMTSSISSPVFTDNGSVKLCMNINVNVNVRLLSVTMYQKHIQIHTQIKYGYGDNWLGFTLFGSPKPDLMQLGSIHTSTLSLIRHIILRFHTSGILPPPNHSFMFSCNCILIAPTELSRLYLVILPLTNGNYHRHNHCP